VGSIVDDDNVRLNTVKISKRTGNVQKNRLKANA